MLGQYRNRYTTAFLNEVLSLNAQEFRAIRPSGLQPPALLNEVLSLNAQESLSIIFQDGDYDPQ